MAITYKSTIPQFGLTHTKTDFVKTKITSSKDAYEYIRQFYFEDIDIYESFFILLLNTSNNTIGYAKISQGGVAGTVADIKIIAKYCVDSLSAHVICSHNHPSGNTEPSDHDKKITAKIKESLKLFDVILLDHIIIAGEENQYYSFADNGIL